MARDTAMEDMVTAMVMDMGAMVIIIMDTPVTIMITIITMTTITEERLLMTGVLQRKLLTLSLPGSGLEDLPWLSRYLAYLVAITIITIPDITATTSGDHAGSSWSTIAQALMLVAIVTSYLFVKQK